MRGHADRKWSDGIDWIKLKQDMREKYPQVKTDLEREIATLYKIDIGHSIKSKDYPPRIEICFLVLYPVQKKEFKRKKETLVKLVDGVAKQYHLFRYDGYYAEDMKEWRYDEKYFSLTPFRKDYKESS